jgi:uncharacterized protein (DUF4415 family)
MKTEISSKLSPEQFARLERLSAPPDEAIDISDIPAVRDWTGAKRGLFYTGPGDKVAIGVDQEVVAWFRSQSLAGEEYEKRINRVLSEHIAGRGKKRARAEAPIFFPAPFPAKLRIKSSMLDRPCHNASSLP